MGLIHAVNAPHSMLVCEKSSIFQDFPMRQVRAAPDKATIVKLKHESILKEMKWKNLRNDVPALRSRLDCSQGVGYAILACFIRYTEVKSASLFHMTSPQCLRMAVQVRVMTLRLGSKSLQLTLTNTLCKLNSCMERVIG